MSPKVKRNNEVRSYSPWSNWRSSSKWIDPTSLSWLQPLKEDHPRMWDFNRPSPGTSMVPQLKGCGCLACRNGGLFTCRQGWTAFDRRACLILLERLHRQMVEDIEIRRKEKPWLHLGIFQETCRVWIRSKEFRLHFEVQTSWPCECNKWHNLQDMWRFISNSCLNWITCANLWWGFQLGPNVSLRKIGLPHYSKPSWKWKAFRM